ncbi:hypothetical protein AX16_003827 [Volvariella volvacea WC 439]|nr:hypothetical protein AX16_003827 [Volvariella volvacea WC 439]
MSAPDPSNYGTQNYGGTPLPLNIAPGFNNPPDSAHPTPPKNRPPDKATRRSRGEIACAECRRLKIRCDKNVPCSTCVKRGCAALCPNGTIPPGDGSRFVLAATEHLHQKIARMEARMRSLEDALAIIQGAHSDRPHPLLTEKFEDTEAEEPKLNPVPEEQGSTSVNNLADALGTLFIDEHGSARFFGRSGGSESLLLKAKELEARTLSQPNRFPLQELDSSYLPPEINQAYQSFPFSPQGLQVKDILPKIESFLPPQDRAITLIDTFLEHLSWMFHIVSRQQVVGELIPAIYQKEKAIPYGPHDLALLLIVLGIGSLVDLTLQPYNLEAQHYYRLARAALTLQPVLTEQSVVTIKVLHLMSIYNGMSGKESNLEQSYAFLDFAGQVAVRVHLDPSLWGFKGREAYERRVYFWNLMAGVLWQSLVTGRPPAVITTYIDCQIPSAEEENLYQTGEVPLGFGIWGFKASEECLISVVKATLAAKPPDYNKILELDQKIRNFTLPQPDNLQNERTAISMQTFVRSHYQDLMLLFLHRGFFAQAWTENPANPLQSRNSRSVTAAYNSACVVLRDTRSQFSKQPLLCARIWRIWSYAFSAAIIVGTVAIRGRHLNLQPPALVEFELSCSIFEQAAEISSRAARAMPILRTMLRKAMQAHGLPPPQYPLSAPSQPPSPHDELAIFGGQTKLYNPSPDAISSPKPPRSQLPPSTGPGPDPPPTGRDPRSVMQTLQDAYIRTHAKAQPQPSTSAPSLPHLAHPHFHPPPQTQPIAMQRVRPVIEEIELRNLMRPSPSRFSYTISSTRAEPMSRTPSVATESSPQHQYFRSPHHTQPSTPTGASLGINPRVMQASAHSRNEEDVPMQTSRTFADLSGGWDGLFREVPAPTFGMQAAPASSGRQEHLNPLYQQHPVGEGGMIDDRWSSFMHNYGIVSADSSGSSGASGHDGPAPQEPRGPISSTTQSVNPNPTINFTREP